ncbi:type VI secretion system tip protein VgrG [Cereibacter sphaeroides]|uniref:type VI secretion system Vgr family protein n=1 Tax=Cereibacter sphaeroides TaxID=1063 RepID=UPI001F3725D3|nr:type VI secretion system tip protein TssI/VgrG [Cereibacter sphaeroides]MCE6959794.1 type VI secretion system tip protein VgrG [Cereibacter sphaeroides]MCE6968738.1 type VI secretion system tip protein VgrG [Cereibacter sphaeroides]MCE6974648.1 type VI secretion system tip protein VgrG [Cereibacter sphaeroides]
MTDGREISVSIPAAAEPVHFSALDGEDAIGRPFRYSLLIASRSLDLKAGDILGTGVAVTVAGESPRHFHGLATGFALDEIRDDHAHYRLTVEPVLALLGLRRDNRIFQGRSVLEIVEEVFRPLPGLKWEKRLQASYPPRDYCVQYGESDLDFIQRLLEHEGIGYFFEHDEDAHRLVLFDANAALKPAPGAETLPYEPDSRISFREGDFITGWLPRTVIREGCFTQSDYDFLKPSSDLMARSESAMDHAESRSESYRYPGDYTELARGDRLAAIRLEELQAAHVRIEGKGTARPLWPGRTFRLELFPREAENDAYLVTACRYRMWDDQYRSGQSRADAGYEVEFTAAPLSLPFRPERRTPRPVMKGPQTAKVVGPAGAEIFTDEHARVKVHFFWDRLDGQDENSSCFVRVSQTWAGAGWGFIQIPRIGQEVIVDFIEGDPDRPIITGRVYNAEQMPPYGLPGSATQSGWKSNSSPGGGGWNELRFEDKAGSEEVYFQAQKDHNELIKNNEGRTIGNDFAEDVGHDATQSVGNDRTESVGNDKSTSVGRNRTVSIGVDDTETVGSNRSLSVGSNETISIGRNSSETIGMNHTQTVALVQTVTVGAARVDSVGAAETRTVGAVQSNTIGASRSVSVGAGQTHSIGASDGWTIGAAQTVSIGTDQSVSIGAKQTISTGADQTTSVGGGRSLSVAKDDMQKADGAMGISVGKTYVLDVKDEVTIKCGSAQVTLKKDGTIVLKGKDITLDASGKINLKAGGEITAKGSKVNMN